MCVFSVSGVIGSLFLDSVMQKYGRRFVIVTGMFMESLGFFIFWLAGFIDTSDNNGWYILVVIVSRVMAGLGCVSIQIAAQSISMIFYESRKS